VTTILIIDGVLQKESIHVDYMQYKFVCS